MNGGQENMARKQFNFDSVRRFVKELIKRFSEDEVTSLSAQLSYFFLLSLFPLLIFLVALATYLPIDYQEIFNIISTYLPDEVTEMIYANLDQIVVESGSGLLSIGILGTIWSASNGINAIMRSLNKAYGVDENRSFLHGRLIAITLLISVLLIIVVALILPVFGRMIGIHIFSFFGASEQFITFWNASR